MASTETFSRDAMPGEEVARLQDEILSLKHRLVTVEARLTTLENASGLFGTSDSIANDGTSAATSALLPRVSPGGASAPSHSSSHPPSGVKVEGNISTHAAAALASRYGKLRSIAQGSRSLGRKGSSSGLAGGDSSDPSMMPSKNPVAFKNGICLVKDRRMIGQMFLTKTLKTSFERIVDHHRLRIFPFISKGATPEQVDHAINEAFRSQGHRLVTDGQVGFEYAYISAGDHKLITLGPADQPRSELSGAVLASEFSKRECYIVVKSKLKFQPYDEILRETAQVISEESDVEEELTFKRCPKCPHRFSRSTYDEHTRSCTGLPPTSKPKVKMEGEDDHLLFFADTEDGSSSGASTPASPVEHSCFCRANSDEQLLECSHPNCDKLFHQSCLEAINDWHEPWVCKTCRIMRPPSSGSTSRIDAASDEVEAQPDTDDHSSPSKGKKRARVDLQPGVRAPALRWSSRLTQK